MRSVLAERVVRSSSCNLHAAAASSYELKRGSDAAWRSSCAARAVRTQTAGGAHEAMSWCQWSGEPWKEVWALSMLASIMLYTSASDMSWCTLAHVLKQLCTSVSSSSACSRGSALR